MTTKTNQPTTHPTSAPGLARSAMPVSLVFIVLYEVISHALVLFPVSVHLGQGVVPWLMERGFVLYHDIVEHRPPLTAWLVALGQLPLDGDTLLAVRLLHLLVILATLALIYVMLRRQPLAAVIAMLYFAALESVFANILLYFEVVVGLIYVAAVYLLAADTASDHAENAPPANPANWRIALAGVLLGLGFFAKPQSVLAGGIIFLWLLIQHRALRKAILFGVALAVPVVAVWLAYALGGLWSEFWFWTITFNQQYGNKAGGVLTGDFLRRMLITHIWLVPLALLWWRSVRSTPDGEPARHGQRYILIIALALSALTFQWPRLGEIHAAAGLPLISLAAGIVLARVLLAPRRSDSDLISLGLSGALLVTIAFNVLTSYIPTAAGFGDIISIGELKPLAAWLNQNSAPGDTMFILPESDSVSQLHLLTGQLPPKTYAILNQYTLSYPPLIERFIKEWDARPPTWMVYFPDLVRDAFPPGGQPLLDYMQNHYQPVQTIKGLPFYGDAIIYHYQTR